MTDRLIRDELVESKRYTGRLSKLCGHDARHARDLEADPIGANDCRVAWQVLALKADDLGNCDGDPQRLLRWFRDFQIDTDEAVEIVLERLHRAELLVPYFVDDPSEDCGQKRFLHIPRFNQRLRQKRAKHPEYDPNNPNQKKRLPKNGQTDDGHVAGNGQTHDRHVPLEGRKEGSEGSEVKRRNASAVDNSAPGAPDGSSLKAGPPAQAEQSKAGKSETEPDVVPMPEKVKLQLLEWGKTRKLA